jgi:endonuclease YncB( thermonuclease family)
MPMLLLTGVYRILGAAPDGDSVRFHPHDPDQWRLVDGPHRVRRNATGGAQLRLDGIDAPETHYASGGRQTRQQPALAHASADALTGWIGFTDVQRNGAETVIAATPDQIPGWLCTRGADINGRCVALAGRGDPPGGHASGQRVFVGEEMLRETVNFHQLAAGQAYPTYYRKLFADLRAAMTAAVAKARAEQGPLWSADRTNLGAVLPSGLADLEGDALVLPKLFRRLADYLALGDGDPSLAGFGDYLAQRADTLTVLPTGQWTGLHSVVEVVGQTVRLLHPPEQLVFDER